MKRCFKCGTEKPRADFYGHPQMSDGLLGKCKACTKTDVLRHRAVNLEKVRTYDRGRSDLPHRIVLRTRIGARWNKKYPERVAAHNAAQRARLVAPVVCETCKEPKRLEKHHHDYSKPLLVTWLCKPCHYLADEVRRALDAS